MRANNILYLALSFLVLLGGCKERAAQKTQALHEAIIGGRLQEASRLIARGANVNAKDSQGWTALQCAAFYGRGDIVPTLVKRGADLNAPNPQGLTPLHLAARRGHKEIGRLLIASGAPADIYLAAWVGDLGTVRNLVRKGTPVNARQANGDTVLHFAAESGDVDLVRFLIEQGTDSNAKGEEDSTPLHRAARKGSVEVARLLVENGANVNAKEARSGTPLYDAVSRRHLDVAMLLIDAGADVNAGKEMGRAPLYAIPGLRDPNEKELAELLLAHGAEITPGTTYENRDLLIFAVENGMRGLAERLLDAGASPNVLDLGRTGRTPLAEAVVCGDKEMAILLLAHGADVNMPDRQGYAPLDYASTLNKDVVELLLAKGADVNRGAFRLAVMRGDKEIVELFLAHGADVNAKYGEDGATPLDEAIARGHKDITEILRKHGAREGEAGEQEQPGTTAP